MHTAWRLFVDNSDNANLIGFAELRLLQNITNHGFVSSGTAYASIEDTASNELAEYAFNDLIVGFGGIGWGTPNNFPTNQSVGKVFEAPVLVDSYEIVAISFAGSTDRTPKDFKLQYSDDVITDQASFLSATWTDADVRTNEIGWGANEVRHYNIDLGNIGLIYEPTVDNVTSTGTVTGTGTPLDDGSHLAWRLLINRPAGDNSVQIAEIEFNLLGVDQSSQLGSVYASSDNGVNLPEHAFDDISGSGGSNSWRTLDNEHLNSYIGKVFNTTILFNELTIQVIDIFGFGTRLPREFEIQYSDDFITDQASFDNAMWVTRYSYANQIEWQKNEIRSFIIPGVVPTFGVGAIQEPSADNISIVSSIKLNSERVILRIITCTFTGDTLLPLTIPISDLVEPVRKNGLSSASLVINGTYSTDVSNYVVDNGQFTINYIDVLADGSQVTTASQTYKINSISSGKSGRQWNLNIYGTTNYNVNLYRQRLDLENVTSLQRNLKGAAIINAKMDRRVMPIDIVTFKGKEYEVEQVSRINNVNNSFMELTAKEVI